VLDHYENPRNVGSFDKKDIDVGTGLVGAPACGDVMKLQVCTVLRYFVFTKTWCQGVIIRHFVEFLGHVTFLEKIDNIIISLAFLLQINVNHGRNCLLVSIQDICFYSSRLK